MLDERILAERLLFPCHCRSIFFPVWEEMALGKVRPRIWQVSCACSLQGSVYFAIRASAFSHSSSRQVTGMVHAPSRTHVGVDTNYWLEIWGSWEIPTFGMSYCVIVSIMS